MTYTEHVKKLSLNRSLLVEEASEAERARKITDIQLDYIYENELFHLLVPRLFGGAEMDLPDFARLMEDYAKTDGSLAWVINLGAGANMFAGFMDESAAAEIFADKKTCVAGSGAPTGTARSEDNGFIIHGKWKYASGSAHANWFSLNAKINNSDEYKSFLVPRDQVELLDTWNVYGMKATSSCDFKVEHAWVPVSYQFDLQKAPAHTTSPLYRFPFMALAEINMLVMVTGLMFNFSRLVLEYTSNRSITIPGYDDELESVLQSRQKVFDLLDKMWELTVDNRVAEEDVRGDFTNAVNRTARLCRAFVDRLYSYAGMSVIFEGNEISRVYRDFKVASQHGLLFPHGSD